MSGRFCHFCRYKSEESFFVAYKINYRNQIILIEFQGKQHYQPVQFFGGEERFKIQQIYDEYKRAYCQRNGYKLIEIPYTDLDNVAKYLHFLTF